MRVIFNVDAISAPLTGIGRYALELARGLADHRDVEALRLYSAYHWVDDPAHALRANRAIAAVRARVPFKSAALELYAQLRAGLFRLHARQLRGWVLHTPNYVLLPFDGPAFTTVHDLSWLNFPQAHPRERVRFLDRHLPRSLEQACGVLTDSQFIADELVGRLGVARSKLHVVPLGVDATFMPRPRAQLAPVLARHGLLDHAYLLVVATQEPRKNLARLVRAYAALPAPLRAAHPLVIAGDAAGSTTNSNARSRRWRRAARRGGSATSTRPNCRCCMPAPTPSRFRRCTKALACPCSRRWPAACPCSPRAVRRWMKSPATIRARSRCAWIRSTRPRCARAWNGCSPTRPGARRRCRVASPMPGATAGRAASMPRWRCTARARLPSCGRGCRGTVSRA